MLVVIPHSTEELKLYSLQKEIIKYLNQYGFRFYSHLPLWIDLDFLNSDSLKTAVDFFSNQKGIILKELLFNENTIYISVNFFQDNKTFNSLLPFLTTLNEYKTQQKENLKQLLKNKSPEEFLPLDLKVFRIGIKEQLSSNSYAISESKWIKLKG